MSVLIVAHIVPLSWWLEKTVQHTPDSLDESSMSVSVRNHRRKVRLLHAFLMRRRRRTYNWRRCNYAIIMDHCCFA